MFLVISLQIDFLLAHFISSKNRIFYINYISLKNILGFTLISFVLNNFGKSFSQISTVIYAGNENKVNLMEHNIRYKMLRIFLGTDENK